MKHAAQFHAGRGAYQCQYCKKFFLRLNYLEMHRTYGCSKNPSRSRPLCDFCGRKFCQPQKLKVHIKRMHSGKMISSKLHSRVVAIGTNCLFIVMSRRYVRSARGISMQDVFQTAWFSRSTSTSHEGGSSQGCPRRCNLRSVRQNFSK